MPNASAVSMTTALGMAGALRRERVRDLLELVRGARVLGLRVVVEVERAAARRSTTFSRIVPNVRVVLKISGSASAERRITFA